MPEISVPYPTFLADTYIMPDEVNANFATLANQALNRYGGSIVGNITAAAGVTVDGVDLSTLGPTAEATFKKLTLTDGVAPDTLLLTGTGGISAAGPVTATTATLSKELVATTGAQVAKTRAFNLAQTANLTQNLFYDGTNWMRDDITLYGQLLQLHCQTGAFVYYNALAGANPATIASRFTIDPTGILSASSSIRERGRTTAMGEWIDVPFNAGNFTAAPATWAVEAADQVVFQYMLIGKTMFVNFYIQNTTLSGSAVTGLRIQLPGGVTTPVNAQCPNVRTYDGSGQGYQVGMLYVASGGSGLVVQRSVAAPAWTVGTNNITVIGQMSFEIN